MLFKDLEVLYKHLLKTALFSSFKIKLNMSCFSVDIIYMFSVDIYMFSVDIYMFSVDIYMLSVDIYMFSLDIYMLSVDIIYMFSVDIYMFSVDIYILEFFTQNKISEHTFKGYYRGWYCANDETFLSDSQVVKAKDDSGNISVVTCNILANTYIY